MKNKWITVFFIGSALLLMLLFPELTLKGTRNGLLLWYQNFLPAVFPFMILSGLLTGYLEKGGPAFAVAAGFLNGYPCGAKTAADLSQRGLLPENTACYYAVFCNMSGPMFMATYAGLKQEMPVIYLTSLGILLFFCRVKSPASRFGHAVSASSEIVSEKLPTEAPAISSPPAEAVSANDDYLLDCTGIVVKAGIYIMYFSILMELLSQPSFSSKLLKAFVPFLELTTGIACIRSTAFPLPSLERYFRIFLCVSGGLCTAFQTKEVTYKLDLSLPRYVVLKLIQASAVCMICFFLSCIQRS